MPNTNCDVTAIFSDYCSLIDFFKNISYINNYENKDKNYNNIINYPKLNYYEDDIIINDINQIQISEFISLLNLSKKNLDFYKIGQRNILSIDESITEIIALKLIK